MPSTHPAVGDRSVLGLGFYRKCHFLGGVVAKCVFSRQAIRKRFKDRQTIPKPSLPLI